jgi:hypothetical protein
MSSRFTEAEPEPDDLSVPRALKIRGIFSIDWTGRV